MSAHDEMRNAFTEDSRPRTRACAGADRDLDLTTEGQTTPSPSSLPRVQRTSEAPTASESKQKIDPETGELLKHDCPTCNRLAVQVAGLETGLAVTQDKLTHALAHIKALKTQDENRRLRHRRRQEVEEIHRDWQEICDKPRSALTNDRFDVIAAALNNDYTREDFRLASVGAKHACPWPRKPGQAWPVVEIAVFGKGSFLEQFANAGARWETAQQRQAERTDTGPRQVRRYEDARLPHQRVLDAIPGEVKPSSSGQECWTAQCAAHDDREASLSIRREVGPDGEIVLLNCFAGCDTADVVAALGLNFADLFESTVVREWNRPNVRRQGPVPLHLRRAMKQLLGEDAA